MRLRLPGGLALLMAAAVLAGCHQAETVGPETVERIVRRSPHQVYRAFSTAMPKSGVQLVRDIRLPNGEISSLTAAIAKTADTSIEISAETPRMRLFHIDMQFLPLAHGAATRVRATVEIDPTMVAESAEMSPRASMDMLKTALYRAIDEVAAGRPLKPLPVERIATRSAGREAPPYDYDDARPAEPRLAAPRRPGEAATIPMSRGRVVPMQSAEPMIDPDAIARRNSFPREY
jgi:hypothetical protein